MDYTFWILDNLIITYRKSNLNLILSEYRDVDQILKF